MARELRGYVDEWLDQLHHDVHLPQVYVSLHTTPAPAALSPREMYSVEEHPSPSPSLLLPWGDEHRLSYHPDSVWPCEACWSEIRHSHEPARRSPNYIDPATTYCERHRQ